ncbi:MBL fold metallo-hydrolase [Paeniglutamicibacter sp. MACA_103]|uniref:MBL fold metallo-hydrolase n=1 Tax=Paeniglutamicibacter sp. MACA_103 TaxID=3377337 RepID=UPI003894BBF5
MFDSLVQAYSTDVADRMLDSLRPSVYDFFAPQDISVPGSSGYHPNENPTPTGMEPFEVYSDDLVTVTATLVEHPPVAPAFAFRFDTAGGSVTISGDTAPCGNLVRLARDTDLLLHEAIDFDSIQQAYVGEDPVTAAATMDHHRKSHTSPVQAGEIATLAGARRLALHHLVPGNAAPEAWQSARESYSGPFYVPEDLDVISFANSNLRSSLVAERA